MTFRKAIATCSRLVVVCLTMSANTAAGQDKPDFSGHWVLESRVAASLDIPQGLTVRQTVARTNVRGEPIQPAFKTITIVREFATLRRTDTYEIGLSGGIVGGFVRGGERHESPRTSWSVTWFGRQLLFTSTQYSGLTREDGPYTEHSELWSLERRDRLVIRIADESSQTKPLDVTLTYRRRR
jgi:hypothetical protein